MSNYVFHPPQQNYHNNQKIDLGDIRISKLVQVPEVSKIIFNGEPLMDLTNDTVTPEVLMEGYTAHAANGDRIAGTAIGGTNDYEQLTNQPKIDNITLIGNKSLHDLGIAGEDTIGTFTDAQWTSVQEILS